MALSRVIYRTRQFWNALWARPSYEQLKLARQHLTAAQFNLFLKLQPSEMSHALTMCERLMMEGDNNPDLLVAALLHDIGKAWFPMRIWERVLIVLGQKAFPQWSARWGEGEPQGWRRAFVIAAKHPAWGADMVSELGASPLVVELVHNHQNIPPEHFGEKERELLSKLQAVDNGK